MSATPFGEMQRALIARHVPLHALYEITERCNYACSHCYLPHRDDAELSPEEALGVIDALADAGTIFLTITGGEVFLRRDAFAILEHARKRELVTRLFTNGYLVDEEKAERISALDPIAVEISLYGPDAATFERVTEVPGSFARTTRAISLLADRGVRVVAKTPVLSINAKRIEETRTLAHRLGAKDFRFDALVTPMDGGETGPLALRASPEDLAEVFAFEKRVLEEIFGGPLPPAEGKPLDAAPCNAGRGSVAISPRGDVFPCVAIKDPAGNVRDRSFSEIWFGADEREGDVLSRLRGITVASLTVCSTCEDRPWCPRCAGVARHEEGSLTAPSAEACRVAAIKRAIFEGRPVPEAAAPRTARARSLPILN